MNDTGAAHARNRLEMMRTAKRAKALHRVRPTSLASPVLRLLSHRRIIDVDGLRLFVDPVSHLGQTVLATGTYEAETVRLFRAHVVAGDVVLDIGANEGFFAALAATLVGATGTVIAVEPQARLQDVLEINLALNAVGTTHLIEHVVGEQDGDHFAMTLYPVSNTGASSLVRRYGFGARTAEVSSITPASILARTGIDRVDFVKIDVEGFEPEVIRAMVPLFAAGRVRMVLLDYHQAILATRGVDADETHRLMIAHGFAVRDGDVGAGYVLYAKG